MPLASANGIEIFYDDVGDLNAPALLLIMGLGTQMIGWPEAFCGRLADRGFRVIRFDNRDIGLTTKIENAPKVDIPAAFLRALAGLPVPAPYNLDDMAKDAIGLMDALGVARAHLIGASMGGMIAQIMAAKHGARTRSLVSIMSTSGDPKLPQAKPAVAAMMTATRPPGSDREARVRPLLQSGRRRPADARDPGEREQGRSPSIQYGMNVYRVIGSPGCPTPEPGLRAKVERHERIVPAMQHKGRRADRLQGLPENQGQALFLQGAVDHEGDVVEAVVTARRDKAAALKLRKRVREIRQPENHRHRPSSATFRGNG
jgi:pimeloyl-ACP methyl ester carboxylesterase